MTTRKGFLAAGAALSALVPNLADAAAPSPSPKPSASASPEPTMPPLAFDLAAFDAALATSAKHRHLFTSVKIDGAEIFGAMRGTLDAYTSMGVALSDVRPAGVLYHGISVFLAFDDFVWKQFIIPIQRKGTGSGSRNEEFAKDLASVLTAATANNPALHATGADDDDSIEWLVANAKARFFVCNNATKGLAGWIARQLNRNRLEVYRDLAAHLVPNAMLVPAGVWAVHAIQERSYTLLQTSL